MLYMRAINKRKYILSKIKRFLRFPTEPFNRRSCLKACSVLIILETALVGGLQNFSGRVCPGVKAAKASAGASG